MAEWKSDQEVFDLADRAARKIVELVNSEGDIWIGSPEHYPGGGGAVVVNSLHQDALDVLSLNPQKIIDEYDRLYKVARAMDPDRSAEITDAFRAIDYSIQDWQGDGATAFRTHVSKLEAFFGQQYNYTVETLNSLGAVMGLAAQVRQDYCSLALATVAACEKALEQNAQADTKFAIGVGTTLVGAAVAVVSGGSTLAASATACVGVAGAGLQSAVEGEKSPEIMSSYRNSCNQLLAGYKDGLADASSIVTRARGNLAAEKNELFEPLPPTVNVNAPAFRYEDFYSLERDAGVFGGKVDAEHKKLLAAQRPHGFADPDSPIQQVLDG